MVFAQLSSSFVAALLSMAQTGLTFLSMRPQLAAAEETFNLQRQPRPPRRLAEGIQPSVIADNIWFRFNPDTPWILQGAQLNVPPGAFHHVKGPSGSGKSTLLKLLAGLYDPEKGSIVIGGLDTHCATSLMLFMPQFPSLRSGSILENLKLFSGAAAMDQILSVAQDTGLDAWIRELPMGYQTIVASGGGNFSGGQRQLIGITAALASPKPILLLDEALSSLDWLTRSRILKSPHFHGRTVIYASHEEVLPQ
jgi:ABC-type bacteriocin/lantibiotic exporter with double-glycine peptidase domain